MAKENLSISLNKPIVDSIKKNYPNISEYIRLLVSKDLSNRGIIDIWDSEIEEHKKAIEELEKKKLERQIFIEASEFINRYEPCPLELYKKYCKEIKKIPEYDFSLMANKFSVAIK